MRRAFVLVVLGGCQQLLGLDTPSQRPIDAPVDDAVIDAAIDAIDASPDSRACPAPPSGCAQVSCAATTSCYYACGTTTPATWTSARDNCVAQQLGCLVTLDSQAELDCLAPLNATFLDQIYVGYRQDSDAVEPDAGWGWECGTSTFVAWANTEPNNFNGVEDCGAVVDGKMVDSNCLSDRRYVCELP